MTKILHKLGEWLDRHEPQENLADAFIYAFSIR